MKRFYLLILLSLLPQLMSGQGTGSPMTLKECLEFSIGHNTALQKDRLAIESAAQSKREVVGSMLPQINAQGSMTYNIQKTTIAMPNFVNSMMPEPMRDPNAPKYMTVTMGMDLGANWGLALSQQILNFSLFNAIEIAKAAEEMSTLGIDADTDDVIVKTTTLFFNTQILEYSIGLFDQSIAVMERMAAVLEANSQIGLVRTVDADRISVNKMNLESERTSLLQALEVQKNLLKLEMGFPMTENIEVVPVDLNYIEDLIYEESIHRYVIEDLVPFKMLKQQQNMLELQRKAAVSETLPMLSLSANYSQNYMGDHFYGETYHHFPVSMVSLNLRFPIFNGMSKNAKIKKAKIELMKSERDEEMLVQSLTMGYNNARMQMDQNRKTIQSQRRNKDLAQEVLNITEGNYSEGIANMTDLLNASSSNIQAQMNYVNALNNCIKAYIDLKKANGTIKEIYYNREEL